MYPLPFARRLAAEQFSYTMEEMHSRDAATSWKMNAHIKVLF